MTITYLKHAEVDKDLWNHCVAAAPNFRIYGMSWYLDLVCSNWDGLVLGNYEAVMPLAWKQKFGIKYSYHPWFAQQLGIFGKEPELYKASDFVAAIPNSFFRYEVSFNSMNKVDSTTVTKRKNYVLPLIDEYSILYQRFNENTQRNIKKANKLGFSIRESLTTDDYIKLTLNEIGFLMNAKQQLILKKLIEFLIQFKYAELIGVERENGELLGAVCLVQFKNRLIYLFSASTQQGKDARAMFKIVDEIIRRNSEKPILLDFEGSNNEGIARFYKGFGSQAEFYYSVNKIRFWFI